MSAYYNEFQSAPPALGATLSGVIGGQNADVSIRAPRVGGDIARLGLALGDRCFNPRPPRGGRPAILRGNVWFWAFQSAPPAWGATKGFLYTAGTLPVSIRAPRVGGDPPTTTPWPIHGDSFNPRPPRGGRPKIGLFAGFLEQFQSAPPA